MVGLFFGPCRRPATALGPLNGGPLVEELIVGQMEGGSWVLWLV